MPELNDNTLNQTYDHADIPGQDYDFDSVLRAYNAMFGSANTFSYIGTQEQLQNKLMQAIVSGTALTDKDLGVDDLPEHAVM